MGRKHWQKVKCYQQQLVDNIDISTTTTPTLRYLMIEDSRACIRRAAHEEYLHRFLAKCDYPKCVRCGNFARKDYVAAAIHVSKEVNTSANKEPIFNMAQPLATDADVAAALSEAHKLRAVNKILSS